MELVFKKETEKEHAHTNVMFNGECAGYITSPKVNTVSGLWHFTPKGMWDVDLNLCKAKSKSELLTNIKCLCEQYMN